MKLSAVVVSLALVAATGAAERTPSDGALDPAPRFAVKPLAENYYPDTARALQQQGTVRIRLCHDATGRVVTNTLFESSGFERLDRAALQMGMRYIFKPGVINGQPQPGCAVVPVEFSLKGSEVPADRGEGMDGIRPPYPNQPPRLVPLISAASESRSSH